MVLEFNIPNGMMKIHADTFFQEARLGKIRKMLKMLQDSSPTLEQIEGIRNWLQEEAIKEKTRQIGTKNKHIGKKELSESQKKEKRYHRILAELRMMNRGRSN